MPSAVVSTVGTVVVKLVGNRVGSLGLAVASCVPSCVGCVVVGDIVASTVVNS